LIRPRLERVINIGRKIGLNDEKGYAIAVFLLLVLVSAFTVGYFILCPSTQPAYNTIYLLDSQHKAADYPITLVAGQNSTFSVYVHVENHVNKPETYQMQTKITPYLTNVPVDTTALNTTVISLNDGQSWQSLQTITENQPGSYSVVFELWGLNPSTIQYEFTYNYCVLNIQIVS
jgi:uncharacterized membrane protein